METTAPTPQPTQYVTQMQQFWAQYHYRSDLPWWMRLLSPLSFVYSAAISIWHWLYQEGLLRSLAVETPVISIGNLTTGGTGKTPVIMALAKKFTAVGLKVVILSRGYAASAPLEYGQPTKPEHGDEPWLIQSLLPEVTVIVGKERSKNAKRAAIDFRPNVILLDDGFQHLRLQRDLDVVLVDGEMGLGNGYTLPLGPLREPLDHLERADIIAISKTPNPSLQHTLERDFETTVHNIPIQPKGLQHWYSRDFLSMDEIIGKSALVFSGIAQPESFEKHLNQAGLNILQHLRFEDHHHYTQTDISQIEAAWPKNSLIITTEKDRVKTQSLIPEALWPYLYSFQIEAALSDDLFEQLCNRLNLSPQAKEAVHA